MTDIDIAAIEARPSNIRAVLSWLSDYMTLTVDQREAAAIAITDLLAERTALIERAEKAEAEREEWEQNAGFWRIEHTSRQSEIRNHIEWMRNAKASLQSAQAEIERLRFVLKPFDDAADALDESDPDDRPIWEHPSAMDITAGDLRRVCAALANPPGDTP